jgi:hypothetical protein
MPLLDLLLAMFWFSLFFLWIWLVISVFADIFRSDDLGGWGKTGWFLAVLLIPLFGVLIYVIARGESMGKRSRKQAHDQKAATDAYIREAAGTGSGGTAAELKELSNLRDKGVLTDDEFQAQKARLLA